MLIAVTNDLMAAAPIEHAARLAGVPCRVASSTQVEQNLPADGIRLVVLDLNATDQVVDLVAAIRDQVGSTTPIIAFGPHVHAAKLQAAKQAGCSQVLTRGQFHQNAGKIIATALGIET